MTYSEWREQPTTIAIRDKDSKDWDYKIFPNWNKAREAMNAARSFGKVAITYEGGSPDIPEFIYPDLP